MIKTDMDFRVNLAPAGSTREVWGLGLNKTIFGKTLAEKLSLLGPGVVAALRRRNTIEASLAEKPTPAARRG